MHKLILAAASIAALALVGPAQAAGSPIVIKFSHVSTPDTPKGKAADKFKELAEKYTDGKVRVEVYPSSQLYTYKEEVEALQLGAVQMLAPSISQFSAIGVKEFEVFDLPYILPDLKTLRKVTDGPVGAKLLKLLDAKGMTGRAYWDNGFKQMSANKKLVAPADYKGLKFRILSSKISEAQFRALGAIPQVLAFGDIYPALQTGVIDGQDNTWSTIYNTKLYEVQRYAAVTNHAYIGYVVVVNKKFWDGLPADIRPQLEKALKEATAFGNALSAKENDDALGLIRKAGTEIVTLTPGQNEAMRKAMMPVYKDVASRVGQPLIDEFLKEQDSSSVVASAPAPSKEPDRLPVTAAAAAPVPNTTPVPAPTLSTSGAQNAGVQTASAPAPSKEPGRLPITAPVAAPVPNTTPVPAPTLSTSGAQNAGVQTEAALAAPAPDAPIGRRVALILGNSSYKFMPKLQNPRNDAADIETALKSLGFETVIATDLDRSGMNAAVERFSRLVRGADVAVVYYSGHGMQFNGKNYLLPVDANLESADDVNRYRLLPVDDLIEVLGSARGLQLVVLDACRSNPVERDFKNKIASAAGANRDAVSTRGFARVDARSGLIITYATAPNDVAADGTGRNSPFTQAFLKEIAIPDVDVRQMLFRVQSDVFQSSGSKQLPEISSLYVGPEIHLKASRR